MMAAIVVLLVLLCVALLGVIGLKQSLADARVNLRFTKEQHAEREAWLEERLKEERDRGAAYRERLAPFSAYEVRR